MKVFKTVLASVVCLMFMTASTFAQDTTTIPDKPTADSELRVWLGGGLVSGAEDGFTAAENSFAVAGGIYFPSNVIPIPGFNSFIGVIYNTADALGGEGLEVTTWDVEFRFIYYLKMSTQSKGLFLTFGPDYQHVDNSDPLAFTGSLFQASTGFGGYIGLGPTKETRLSVVVERDFMGDILHRDWRILTGLSRGFDPKIF